ncbi:MAG: hypothetical protein P8X74_23440, partial [Reinekea sp.]
MTIENRYGDQFVLSDAYGFGLKQIASVHPDMVNPTEVIVDPEIGTAITNAGFFAQGATAVDINGAVFPDSYRATVFDVQQPSELLLVGGNNALPVGAGADKLLATFVATSKAMAKQEEGLPLTDLEQSLIDNRTDQSIVLSLDSVGMQLVHETEDGIDHKRLYVATGHGGVSRLNLDEQNGLQLLVDQPADSMTSSVAVSGNLMWAGNTALGDGKPPKDPCAYTLFSGEQSGLSIYSNYDKNDPQLLTTINTNASGILKQSSGWLIAGGNHNTYMWKIGAGCDYYADSTLADESDQYSSPLTLINERDSSDIRTFDLPAGINAKDALIYNDYLYVAASQVGVLVYSVERPEENWMSPLTTDLQSAQPNAYNLNRYGNVLFVASKNGLIVLDISEHRQEQVISAGNTEQILDIDLFKDRIIAAGGTSGLRTMQMPAALVVDSTAENRELVSYSEAQRFTVRFNEVIELTSLDETVSLV